MDNIVIKIENKVEFMAAMAQCEILKIRWNSGQKPLQYKPWEEYVDDDEDECFESFGLDIELPTKEDKYGSISIDSEPFGCDNVVTLDTLLNAATVAKLRKSLVPAELKLESLDYPIQVTSDKTLVVGCHTISSKDAKLLVEFLDENI